MAQVPVFACRLAEAETIHNWHQYIQYHEVRLAIMRQPQSRLAIGRIQHLVLLLLQQAAQHPAIGIMPIGN
jgi:hypothetical protein